MKEKDTKNRIIKILTENPEGLTIKQLTFFVKQNRLTVTKYMHELIGESKINVRKLGNVKLITLNKKESDLIV